MTTRLEQVKRFFRPETPTPVQQILLPQLEQAGIELFIKRDDMTHPFVSGNKYRKLKYNVLHACEQDYNTLLSFGGAFSNHIHALAALGQELGIKTIGVIRGEPHYASNPTLSFAQTAGMQLHFVTREQYRHKHSPDFLAGLRDRFGDFYMIPEGGSNSLALPGCAELALEVSRQIPCLDYLSIACGTGGTLAGLSRGIPEGVQILGFPVLKGGDFLNQEIHELLLPESTDNWRLVSDYHFGGYAKADARLVEFKQEFERNTGIVLDPIYTAKMMFGILDLIVRGEIKAGSRVVAIHSGGLQGNAGWQQVRERAGKGVGI